jgi:hypothetical protein
MQVRSACAPCARNQHPVCLITQVHTLRSATCAIQHVPARLITQVHTLRSATCAIQHVPARLITQVHTLRSATCAMDFVPRIQRPLESRTRRQRKPSNPTCCMSRFLIVRDPRRSQLRRSTRSTICPSRAALLDAVTAMFGRSLRLPLALCSATDAVATICPSRAALLDAVTALFGRSLRLPLALCSATDAVATMCNRSHLSASAGFAARSTTRGDVDTFTASVETM